MRQGMMGSVDAVASAVPLCKQCRGRFTNDLRTILRHILKDHLLPVLRYLVLKKHR